MTAAHPNAGSDDAGIEQMRWHGQRIDRLDTGALPGLAALSGFVRSVRTPEFRDMTFHEILAKSALNHVPDDARMLAGEWTINPYRGCAHACQYCFARNTHTRLGLDVGGDFDREIVVKTNIVEVLRAELARKRRLPPRVAFGTNTDVYQRAEGRYALMPGIIDALTSARIPFSILTKSPLIRRDLDRLLAASRVTTVHLGLSISILDEQLCDPWSTAPLRPLPGWQPCAPSVTPAWNARCSCHRYSLTSTTATTNWMHCCARS